MNVIFVHEKRALFSLVILFDIGPSGTLSNYKKIYTLKEKRFMIRDYVVKFIICLHEILTTVLFFLQRIINFISRV